MQGASRFYGRRVTCYKHQINIINIDINTIRILVYCVVHANNVGDDNVTFICY